MSWVKPQCARGWRRAVGCAVTGLALAAGCEEAPREAPPAAARPLSEWRDPAKLQACEHLEPTADLEVAALIPLPRIDEVQPGETQAADANIREADGPSLLPPEALPLAEFTELPPVDDAPAAPAAGDVLTADAEARLAAAAVEAKRMLAEISPPVTGQPTGAVVDQRAQARIQRGYALAQRGANFAARGEFLHVLWMIAEDADQARGDRRSTTALASGLRALEEANDFAPRGAELDAEASLAVILSSHRTPVAKSVGMSDVSPPQLADLYFRYGQLQLGAAVAGEPAGSMALHALGKLYSQLGRTEPESHPHADRQAFAYQQAALLARDDNHLAAHELGVLLAETGHYVESEHLLSQVASREPHPMVLRNLSRVQRRLGRDHLAVVNERQAEALAAGRPSGGSVVWVPPATLAQSADPLAPRGQGQVVANTAAGSTARTAPPTTQRAVSDVTRLPGGYMR